jgi:hypothetical protein
VGKRGLKTGLISVVLTWFAAANVLSPAFDVASVKAVCKASGERR